jgi:hypothetical protein
MILRNEPVKDPIHLDEMDSPPPFEDTIPAYGSSDSSTVFIPQTAPPEFSLYEAQFFTVGNGNIVSHDPHLNTDGKSTPFGRNIDSRSSTTRHR